MRVVMRVVHTCGEAEAYSITAGDYSIALRSPQTASSGCISVLNSAYASRQILLLVCSFFARRSEKRTYYTCKVPSDEMMCYHSGEIVAVRLQWCSIFPA